MIMMKKIEIITRIAIIQVGGSSRNNDVDNKARNK